MGKTHFSISIPSVAIVIVTLVLFVSFYFWRSYSKFDKFYCDAENKKFSEAELYDLALEAVYQHLDLTYSALTPVQQSGLKHYKSAEEILRQNPKCCDEPFDPYGGNESLEPYFKSKGNYHYTGSIYIELKNPPAPRKSKRWPEVPHADFIVTNCGRVHTIRTRNGGVYDSEGNINSATKRL